MKKLNASFIFIIILLLCKPLFSQSDYQILQDFKGKAAELEKAIENVDSLSELQKLSEEINDFSDEYVIHKELLDKSLYPGDFISSIQRLKNKLNLRRHDFTKITTLQAQVSGLQSQLDQLNLQNSELLAKVKNLETQVKNDKSKFDDLQRNIAELRSSIQKRDLLVMNMLDSLMPSGFMENGSLSSKEKEKVYSEAEKINIFSNIKRAVNDNIRFLEITTLKPDDIVEIKRQKNEFEKTWQNIGPAIIDIYSAKGENVRNLKSIDSSFSMWNQAINTEAWNSIRQEYTNKGIYLNKFSNGKEFVHSLSDYIDDEIKTSSSESSEEAIKNYENFVDSLWEGKIKHEWLPFLTENKMISDSQKDSIETKIAQWENQVNPNGFNWLYILIAVLIIILTFVFFRSRSSSKKTEN